MKISIKAFLLSGWLTLGAAVAPALGQHALVLQSDFGLAEGSVAEMKGVAFAVDRNLRIFDLTHLIPPFDIWEAAVRLQQVAPFWPSGTVFVSIVDPGVGTARRSVVVRSKTGHLFVGPDNGSFTFVAERLGVESVREIDETVNRLAGSERSHTFHGRDIFAYTGARLAAGALDFEQVGPVVQAPVVRLAHVSPAADGPVVRGAILALDKPFGNVWTNIRVGVLDSAGFKLGDTLNVTIRTRGAIKFQGRLPFVKSFGAVGKDRGLAYIDSLLDLAFALNQASFAARYQIGRGPDWQVEISLGPATRR